MNVSKKETLEASKDQEKTSFVIQTKNKNVTQINEKLAFLESYEKEGNIKMYYTIYTIFTQKERIFDSFLREVDRFYDMGILNFL